MAVRPDVTLEAVIPRNYLRSVFLGFPLRWNHERPYNLPPRDSGSLGPYYIEWWPGNGIYGEDWTTAPRDEDGVILTAGIKKYHPVRIAQFGLHNYNAWLRDGSPHGKEAFLAQAKWLRDHQINKDNVEGCYIFDFPWERFGATSGWISAMAQGEAMSLLLRAWQIDGDPTFLEAAETAGEPFKFDISEGGVVWKGKAGEMFFQEVAVSPASHILNGHIYALWGLLDLLRVKEIPWVRTTADAGNNTLKEWLPHFDSGHWSYYMLFQTARGYRNLAQLKYQAFHISQLRVMAAFTGDEIYNQYADRWSQQLNSFASRFLVYANSFAGLIPRLTRADSVAGGARSIFAQS